MNRYDWLTWLLSLLVSAEVREAAKAKMRELDRLMMEGADKRAIVEEMLIPGITTGGIYLARALIELWLGQMRKIG